MSPLKFEFYFAERGYAHSFNIKVMYKEQTLSQEQSEKKITALLPADVKEIQFVGRYSHQSQRTKEINWIQGSQVFKLIDIAPLFQIFLLELPYGQRMKKFAESLHQFVVEYLDEDSIYWLHIHEPIPEEEIKKREIELGFKLPTELRSLYQEIGCLDLTFNDVIIALKDITSSVDWLRKNADITEENIKDMVSEDDFDILKQSIAIYSEADEMRTLLLFPKADGHYSYYWIDHSNYSPKECLREDKTPFEFKEVFRQLLNRKVLQSFAGYIEEEYILVDSSSLVQKFRIDLKIDGGYDQFKLDLSQIG